jgi:HD-GYP domain-containing protein (c-di-GMP phosphodiesterase class II)
MSHQDAIESLNRRLPLRDKLIATHEAMRAHFPFIARIAIAIYDPKTALLTTYLHSSGGDDPLPHYQTPLSEAPSLARILELGRPRVINNLVTFEGGAHEHTRRIGRQGYGASYTMPMFSNGVFCGFIFFNSYQKDVFTEPVLHQLDIFGHLIALLVINELAALRTLLAAVATTSHITHVRDPETGSHLDRMSRYARLIARALAPQLGLDDEYVEHVFMFAPLHDVGKIGIPDRILLKQGSLTPAEYEIMRRHVTSGREIIDGLVASFGLAAIRHVDMLRNIVEFHHEAVNGQGYLKGLRDGQIPLEARIIAVADVFDALTSRRPYKDAWTSDAAFDALRGMADEKLDADCVGVFIENRAEAERIQARFREDPLG